MNQERINGSSVSVLLLHLRKGGLEHVIVERDHDDVDALHARHEAAAAALDVPSRKRRDRSHLLGQLLRDGLADTRGRARHKCPLGAILLLEVLGLPDPRVQEDRN